MPNFFDEIKKDAFGSHLNIQIESIGNVGALGFMTALPEHLNLSGRIHGGVLMALADVVAAHATVLKLPAGSCTTTIESKTNFIRSAGLVKINAKAVPIHVGRTTMVWQTTVSDESGSTLAIVMQTQLVLKCDQTAVDEPCKDPLEQVELEEKKLDLANPNQELSTQPATSTADRRKAQILSAAFRVISEKGFANAAMREIALEAGMPVPTMYLTCVVRTNCWGQFSTTTSARSRSVCSSQAIGPPRRHKSFALRSRPLSPNSTVTSRRYG